MLVLTRKLDEQIRIGDDITISILRVKGNTVRVGIEAPREIRVVRGELPVHDDTMPERQDATTTGANTASTGCKTASQDAQGDGGPLAGGAEFSGPATTAVRQFLANRARRNRPRPGRHRAKDQPLAAPLTRSA